MIEKQAVTNLDIPLAEGQVVELHKVMVGG